MRLTAGSEARNPVWRLLTPLASVCLAVFAGIEVIPRETGAGWGVIAADVSRTSVSQLAAMTAMWALGLLAYTTVLTRALPGLSRVRALTLNLTGSAVSNLLPFGGAAGVGLNFRMVRSWGFSANEFVSFTVATQLVNVAAKLALPTAAVTLLAFTGVLPDRRLSFVALVAAVALVVGVCLVISGMRRSTAEERPGSHLGHGRVGTVKTRIREAFRAAGRVLARGWWCLTASMTAYSASHVALLWLALRAVHGPVGPANILAAYAVERLLTLVPLTPGGAGVVEIGMTGLLVGLGGSPAGTAAGVLIYRAFVFGLEIPVGGMWLLTWLWCRHRAARRIRRAVTCESPT
ncbi:MAG: flippase-like domain-containing protein [Propionibacteriales bacterium]|nr:flippase-like domain-containing protein [Propionibacteriales bacterium]